MCVLKSMLSTWVHEEQTIKHIAFLLLLLFRWKNIDANVAPLLVIMRYRCVTLCMCDECVGQTRTWTIPHRRMTDDEKKPTQYKRHYDGCIVRWQVIVVSVVSANIRVCACSLIKGHRIDKEIRDTKTHTVHTTICWVITTFVTQTVRSIYSLSKCKSMVNLLYTCDNDDLSCWMYYHWSRILLNGYILEIVYDDLFSDCICWWTPRMNRFWQYVDVQSCDRIAVNFKINVGACVVLCSPRTTPPPRTSLRTRQNFR